MGRSKLERALRRGGVAERCPNGQYRVWRCANRRRRALGFLSADVGDRLCAEGKLRASAGQVTLYHWPGTDDLSKTSPHVSPPVIGGLQTPRRKSRNVLARALAEAKDAREHRRLANAAARFIGDIEQSLQSGRITMNWETLGRGRVDEQSFGTSSSPLYRTLRARERLEHVARELGADDTQRLEWALVRNVSCVRMADQLGLSPDQVIRCIYQTLGTLADVYDERIVRIR